MSDLMALLRERPQLFNLFQAISILERSEPERQQVGTSLGIDEAVRLSAQVDLGFSPSDISSLQESGRSGPPLTLKSGVFTLAGANGPLPMPFTELLLDRRRMRDHAGFEFLDMFNQRLLGFLYRSRRKHHLALSGDSLATAPLVRSLDALSGLGRTEGARGPGGEQAWLRHAGVQGAAPRSMASLLAVARDRMGVHFSGRQFIGGWHALAPADRARLHDNKKPAGLQARLGMGASLGARAWDQGAGMELTTPPLKPEVFSALLPGGPANALLGWLVARHLQRDVEVVLQPELRSEPVTCLGAGQPLAPRLGLSTWLCSPPSHGQPRSQPDGGPPRYQSPRFVLSPDSTTTHTVPSAPERI